MDKNGEVKTRHNKGRPLGFRMSEKAKDRIRESRLGQQHSKKTKDRISQSLINYFKKRDSLADNIRIEYEHFPCYVDKWIVDHKDVLDDTELVMTEKKLAHLKQLELCFGNEIDRFGHNATPEFFLMLKEELLELGLSDELRQLYSIIS